MTTPIHCILIDDELHNISLLKKMLNKFCQNVIVIATESNPLKGLKLIEELKPELVFLDIQMPKLNGFQLLKKLEPISFEVIFVTAYTEFAIEAFEHHAIGYVTKPILKEKLVSAVQNAAERIQQMKNTNNIFSLLEKTIQHNEDSKIALSTLSGLVFVNKEDIVYCESSGNYTTFHFSDNKKIVVSRQLGEFEKLLTENYFVRIHDTYLISLKYVTEYIKGRGGEIVLNHKITLPVSISKKDNLLSRFDKWVKH